MKASVQLGFEIMRVQAILSRSVSAQGVGFAEFMIMTFLHDAPAGKLRRMDLAMKMGLTASGVTRMILPMEKIGLVKRVESENDARERFASLTTAGERILEEVQENIVYKMDSLFESSKAEVLKGCVGVLAAVQ